MEEPSSAASSNHVDTPKDLVLITDGPLYEKKFEIKKNNLQEIYPIEQDRAIFLRKCFFYYWEDLKTLEKEILQINSSQKKHFSSYVTSLKEKYHQKKQQLFEVLKKLMPDLSALSLIEKYYSTKENVENKNYHLDLKEKTGLIAEWCKSAKGEVYIYATENIHNFVCQLDFKAERYLIKGNGITSRTWALELLPKQYKQFQQQPYLYIFLWGTFFSKDTKIIDNDGDSIKIENEKKIFDRSFFNHLSLDKFQLICLLIYELIKKDFLKKKDYLFFVKHLPNSTNFHLLTKERKIKFYLQSAKGLITFEASKAAKDFLTLAYKLAPDDQIVAKKISQLLKALIIEKKIFFEKKRNEMPESSTTDYSTTPSRDYLNKFKLFFKPNNALLEKSALIGDLTDIEFNETFDIGEIEYFLTEILTPQHLDLFKKNKEIYENLQEMRELFEFYKSLSFSLYQPVTTVRRFSVMSMED